MKTSNRTKLGGLLVLAALTSTAHATDSKFYSSADAMIFATSSYADTGKASGKGPGMFAGADGGLGKKRSLVKFDFSTPVSGYSAITGSNNVTAANLRLIIGQIAGEGGGDMMGPPDDQGPGCGTSCDPASRTFTLHVVTTNWNEGPAGTNACSGSPCTSMSGTGQGWTSANTDVSWDYYNKPSTWAALATDDQDYNAACASETFTNFTFGLWMDWVGNSTHNSGFVTAINSWLDNGSNYGLLIKAAALESDNQSFIGWWTRDGATANSNNNAIRPLLTVTY